MTVHTINTMKDDRTSTAIVLLLGPSLFLLGTLTPNGFVTGPLSSLSVYGELSVVMMLEGGEGGRPVEIWKV